MPTTSAKLPINVASHADVLKGSSRVSGAGTRDEPPNNVCVGGYNKHRPRINAAPNQKNAAFCLVYKKISRNHLSAKKKTTHRNLLQTYQSFCFSKSHYGSSFCIIFIYLSIYLFTLFIYLASYLVFITGSTGCKINLVPRVHFFKGKSSGDEVGCKIYP